MNARVKGVRYRCATRPSRRTYGSLPGVVSSLGERRQAASAHSGPARPQIGASARLRQPAQTAPPRDRQDR
jgi:hypothetical protein